MFFLMVYSDHIYDVMINYSSPAHVVGWCLALTFMAYCTYQILSKITTLKTKPIKITMNQIRWKNQLYTLIVNGINPFSDHWEAASSNMHMKVSNVWWIMHVTKNMIVPRCIQNVATSTFPPWPLVTEPTSVSPNRAAELIVWLHKRLS